MLDLTWLLQDLAHSAVNEAWLTEAGALGGAAAGSGLGASFFATLTASARSTAPDAASYVFDWAWAPAFRWLPYVPRRRSLSNRAMPDALAALYQTLTRLDLNRRGGSWAQGCAASALALEWPVGLPLLVSVDPLLLLAELLVLAALVASLGRLLGQLALAQPFYDDLITLCKVRNVSLAETLGLLTLTLGFVVFDAVLAASEDDLFDNVGLVLVACICTTAVLTLAGVDVHYFFMTSGASSGEPRLRVLYGDALNNLLSLTRVLFCWLRYLFYDLQAELVDMAFHFVDTSDSGAALSVVFTESVSGASQGLIWGLGAGLMLQGLALTLDLGCWAFVTVLGGLKLLLALYLFWLMLDLLVLRAIAHTESSGFTGAQRPRLVGTSRSARTLSRRRARRAARRRPRYLS